MFEIAYAVIIQAVSSMVAPKFPAICRVATFTIEVSINSMMAQVITVIVISHFLAPTSYVGGAVVCVSIFFIVYFSVKIFTATLMPARSGKVTF